MKKIVAFIISIILLMSIACADVDLSSMSYNDLIALNQKLLAEITSRPEWKEVTVPAGQWKIGTDIPAGTYSITAIDTSVLVNVWRKAVGDYSNRGRYFGEIIEKGQSYGKITLEAGYILELSDPAIIAPPISLGF